MDFNKVNSSLTTLTSGRDSASIESLVAPKRAWKTTAAQRAMVDGVYMDTDNAVAFLAKTLEDLLLVARPNNDQDTEEVCKAAGHLLTFNAQRKKLYKRYESKWLDYVKQKRLEVR